MDVLSNCALPAEGLKWQPRPGVWALTVVCKATFLLQPGESPLASQQESINEDDNHWDDDTERSLYAACDLVPVKPRVDVLLVGSAYAPGNQPARSLVARIIVAEIDKSIEVVCERSLGQYSRVIDGARFTKMRLVYERAAGGAETWNPVGVRPDLTDAQGLRALPNLQPVGEMISSNSHRIAPVGFGPIAPSWPLRRNRLGAHASSWSSRDVRAQPLPEGMDLSFFNAAPPDQQLQALREDERIVLESLHPEHPRLITRLPGVAPRAVLEAEGSAPRPLVLRADTLWIDTDRALCTVTWRGQLALRHAQQTGRVIISMDQSPPSFPSYRGRASSPMIEVEDHPFEGTLAGALNTASQALPFASSPGAPLRSEEQERPQSSPLPFAGSAPPRSEERASSGGLPFTPSPPRAEPKTEPPPFTNTPAPPPPMWSAPQPPLAVTPRDDSSVVMRAPPPPVTSAPFTPPPMGAPSGLTIGAAAVAAAATAPARVEPNDVSAFAASNAAAGAATYSHRRVEDERSHIEPLSSPAPSEASEALHLVWFDPESVPRIRRTPSFRQVIRDSEGEPLDPDLDDPAFAKDPMNVEDRREVFLVIARADTTDELELEEALGRSVRRDGKFVPSLLLVEGELSFPFDELETLKATVAATTPHASSDERLKVAIADADAFLQKSDMPAAPAIPEGLTVRIREAFASGRRPISSTELDAHVERALITKRHYQKRELFGGQKLRALLTTSGAKRPIPTYLPESVSRDLPLSLRFRARLVVEAYFRVDQYETSPTALKAFALGWFMPTQRS